MARVFITGSSDGLGLMAARLLIDQGHEVVLHGDRERADYAFPERGSGVVTAERPRDQWSAADGAWLEPHFFAMRC